MNVDNLSPEQETQVADFFIWFIKSGRGFGKSWTGSSWINEGAERATGEYMGLLGRDAHDVRAFMVEGDSGILRTARNDFYPKYEPSKRLITWPNGVKANIFYAEEPKTVRGPNNFLGWVDEPASFQDAALGLGDDAKDTAMSNFLMTLRIGTPRLLVTGTPKPLKLILDLQKYEGAVVVDGGTRENKQNLAPRWLKEMENKYAGTRLGQQELDGKVLDDNPGALWRRAWIERNRVKTPPPLERVVVGVDPPASSGEGSAECGIVCVGRYMHPEELRYHFYVLEDRSRKGTPREWAETVTNTYKYHLADAVIAERNNGGEMVESTITNVDPNTNVETVWASRGKYTRAEPVSALYEQNRVHHVGDARNFEDLEEQMCTWEPGMESPDRMDAGVWAHTSLMEAGIASEDSESHTNFWENSQNDESGLRTLRDR